MSTGQVEKATKKSQLITTKSHHINNGLKLFTFADDCMKEGLAHTAISIYVVGSKPQAYKTKLTMPRPYSEDLRWRAIWMKEMLGFQVDEVAAALWMSPRTIERYVLLEDQQTVWQCISTWNF